MVSQMSGDCPRAEADNSHEGQGNWVASHGGGQAKDIATELLCCKSDAAQPDQNVGESVYRLDYSIDHGTDAKLWLESWLESVSEIDAQADK